MSHQAEATGLSPDKNVELNLYWDYEAPSVEVVVYIHNVPKDYYVEELPPLNSPTGIQFNFIVRKGGDIPDAHWEYFDYIISGRPKNVSAFLSPSGTAASTANAIAL